MGFGAIQAGLFLLSLTGIDTAQTVDAFHHALSQRPQPLQQGARVGWDRATMVRVSDPKFRYAGYARMVQLKDGALVCVYEGDGSIMATRSEDGGKTWQTAVPVAWHQDGIKMSAPDLLQLQDGSILCCYNPRPWKISGTRNFGIRTRKSYDGGKSWMHGRLLYESGHKFGDGCWEPSAIQLPDGEIQLYFSNEGIYRKSNEQNISMLSSHDGGLTWSKEPKIISFRPRSRDGMPVPLLLRDGSDIIVAIEDLGWLGYFKPGIVRTSAGNPWPAPVGSISFKRQWALAHPLDVRTYAGAPYLRQLHTGEVLLSYQGTEGRNNDMHNADMKVAMADPATLKFDRKSAPFEIPPRRHALWNSMTVLEDNTVIAVTSTNAFTSRQLEVWMIKGYLLPEVNASRLSVDVDGYKTENAWQEPLPLFLRRNGSTRYRGGVTYDDQHLYFLSRVTDKAIHADSADVENNDGVAVSISHIAADGLATAQPGETSYKFFLSADNHLVCKKGKNGRWFAHAPGETQRPQHASRTTSVGYIQELAIPWDTIGGKPAAGEAMAVNISATESNGGSLPVYRESLSGSHEDKPYTWLPVLLR